jgi:hypothetical protein
MTIAMRPPLNVSIQAGRRRNQDQLDRSRPFDLNGRSLTNFADGLDALSSQFVKAFDERHQAVTQERDVLVNGETSDVLWPATPIFLPFRRARLTE